MTLLRLSQTLYSARLEPLTPFSRLTRWNFTRMRRTQQNHRWEAVRKVTWTTGRRHCVWLLAESRYYVDILVVLVCVFFYVAQT